MATAKTYFTPRATKTTTKLYCLEPAEAKAHVDKKGTAAQRKWIAARGFEFKVGRSILLPAADGSIAAALLIRPKTITPWSFGSLPLGLPKGRYELANDFEGVEDFSLGWALGQYRYDHFKKNTSAARVLVWPKAADSKRVLRLAEATYLVRDLVNAPAETLGPAELAAAAKKVGAAHGAKTVIVRGKKLEKEYPMVHAVGRASSRAPLYVDLRWGKAKDPKITIVGKGVIFDSGGLNIKPGAGMLTMKKDMGGAAHAIALAGAIMDAKLPVQLRLLVPCVENSISGNAFRPMDIFKSRKGITVEIGNTDAEGRLILCDALADAAEGKPEFILDFATLTGAARVALGADLPALFCNDELLATEFIAGGQQAHDAVWRMPLHADYNRFLQNNMADVSNISSTPYGGAITAALFLQKFVGTGQPWAHIDVMAYNQSSRPGRPKGGEAMSLRAAYEFIERRYKK
ncbi:MAG: leucyl aminopeptidase [Polyangiales bacterium]|jgi:leucyl aminopeptidase